MIFQHYVRVFFSTPTTRNRISVPESCYLRHFVFWIAWTLHFVRLTVYFSVSHMTSELGEPPGSWDIHSHQAPRPLSHAFGEHPVTWFFLLSNQVKNTDDQDDDDDDGDGDDDDDDDDDDSFEVI